MPSRWYGSPIGGYFQTVEQQPDDGPRVGAINFRKVYPQEWSTLRSLQFLFGDEEVTVITQDAETPTGSSPADHEDAEGQWSAGTPHSPGPLSPIAEEDESLECLDSYLLHDDPDLQAVLAETRCQLDVVFEHQ